MKLAWVLFGLVACTAPQTPVTPAAVTECAACRECPECPECPTCPEPPPQPVAQDWHCMEIHRSAGDVSGFCWTTAAICERKRKLTVAENMGEPSECVAQRTAFCTVLSDPAFLIHQAYCARTAENCETRRQYLIDHPNTDLEQLSPCESTLNTDTFTRKPTDADMNRAP